MLQRIQSVYLAIVALVSGVMPLLFPLWGNAGGNLFAWDVIYIGFAFAAVVFLAIAAIFMYKNRQTQFVINRVGLLVNLILLGYFVYRSLNLSGGTDVPEKGIGMFIPVISIVFLVLANRAIKKDEDLVKSVDRLR